MSVELQNQRNELLQECIRRGWFTPEAVPADLHIPEHRLKRWFRRLYETPADAILPGPRLLNRFMLGADPEFVFVTQTGAREDARSLGLKTGPAFGADNNSRLVELRPEPYRSALAVTASLWACLRWLPRYYPSTMNYTWRAGAYFQQDGLGGHIHFGRKAAKLRATEIAALDRLAYLLYTAGVYDRAEGRLRVVQSQGASHGHYGALSDIRKQPHGYEYRTLPSWLDSPWLTYLNLVLAKLMVARCELFPALTLSDKEMTQGFARQMLTLILAYFAPLDDDARLAYQILRRNGLPKAFPGMDFRNSWGIFAPPGWGEAKEANPDVMPVTVPVSKPEEKALMEALLANAAPEPVPLPVLWEPSTLPKGFVPAIVHTETRQAPGLGEALMGYCTSVKGAWSFVTSGTGGYPLTIPANVYNQLVARGFSKKYGIEIRACDEGRMVYVNASRDFTGAEVRYFIESLAAENVIPLWKIKDAKPELLSEKPKPVEEAKQSPRSRFLPGSGL